MTSTTTKARTVTITRLALVGHQFSRFFQRFPDNVMEDARRNLFLDHLRRGNLDQVCLVGLDESGFAVALARCTVDWDGFKRNALDVPKVEVLSGKEGLEITVATLDAFDQVVKGYQLTVSGRVRLTPCDMTRDELMVELNLADAEPIQWRDQPTFELKDVDTSLPELSMELLLVDRGRDN